MFTLALAALVAASSVAAVPSARFERNVHRSVPAQFVSKREYAKDADLLEPYADYNSRYMEFNCRDHHNTEFFDLCCHPQLKTHITNEWPDQCYADCDEDDGDADKGTEESAPVSIAPETTSHAAPAKTSAPVNVGVPAQPTKIVTSTKKVEPTKSAAPTTSASSGGSSSGGSSSGGSWNTGGQATFFYQDGQAGACGTVHSDSDKIIAIQSQRYGNGNERSATCGRQIEIVNLDNGKSVIATVADECPTCVGTVPSNSLDLSVGAFTAIADESQGEVQIKWKFIS